MFLLHPLDLIARLCALVPPPRYMTGPGDVDVSALGGLVSFPSSGGGAAVRAVDGSHLRALVPAGATTGNVVVTSDGISSTSDARFPVVTAFELRGRAPWDPSPGNKRVAVVGQTLSFDGVAVELAYDSGTASICSSADADWLTMSVSETLDNPAAGTFPATGSFRADDTVATAMLRGRAGTLESRDALSLSIEDISKMCLDQEG